MSAGITIAGGGTTAVSTPEMQRASAQLHATVDALAGIAARVAALAGERTGAGPVAALDEALALLRAARGAAADTAAGLLTAALRYGQVEDTARSAFQGAAALDAGVDGALLGAAFGAAGIDREQALRRMASGLVALLPRDGSPAVTPAQVQRQRSWDRTWTPLSNLFAPVEWPVTAPFIGAAVSSIDDFVRGVRGTETVRLALADDPAASASTQRSARYLASDLDDLPGLAVRETGGRQQEVPGRAAAAGPRDLAALGRLVPDDGDGRAQVRVEGVRGADGVQRWVVAVAGTTTFDPEKRDQVFDMRSNLQGVGQEQMDAEVATERALEDAGVRPSDPVLVVGHSQGALVATGLAQSGRFDVRGVVTLGGPTRAVRVPASVPVLAVEHTDDWIPTLGGAAPAGPPASNVVRITRTVYDDTPPPIVGHVAMDPAHQPSEYVRTLAAADGSDDPRVRGFLDRVRPFLSGAAGTEDLWRADRVPVSAAPPAAPTAVAAPAPRASR